jgi:hypothetical protein
MARGTVMTAQRTVTRPAKSPLDFPQVLHMSPHRLETFNEPLKSVLIHRLGNEKNPDQSD